MRASRSGCALAGACRPAPIARISAATTRERRLRLISMSLTAALAELLQSGGDFFANSNVLFASVALAQRADRLRRPDPSERPRDVSAHHRMPVAAERLDQRPNARTVERVT